jgi:hypothetical protein
MGGNSSAYKINADGFVGPEINNLEIAAKRQSLCFCFCRNRSKYKRLFHLSSSDSIRISYNGRDRWVQLEAGVKMPIFSRTRRSPLMKPGQMTSLMLFWVTCLWTLIKLLLLKKACRIYVHADAPLVINGTIRVNGDKDSADRVYFRGDRLDEPIKIFLHRGPAFFSIAEAKTIYLTMQF